MKETQVQGWVEATKGPYNPYPKKFIVRFPMGNMEIVYAYMLRNPLATYCAVIRIRNIRT